MKNCITQYKLLFYLSWIVLYLLFPSWISKHLFFQDHGFPNISYPLARSFVIIGLVMYFSVAAYFMNRFFNALSVSSPLIIKISDFSRHIKSHIWLVIVCCLSVILHVYASSSITVQNEVRALDQTMWMFDVIKNYWHRLSDFPIQYFFWSLIAVLILIKRQKKIVNSTFNYISEQVSAYNLNNIIALLFIFFMVVFFNIYSSCFPYYSFGESLQVLRYPPISRFLYLTVYSAFGMSYAGPRILQFMFYILGAVYLYRTIYLFREKETALLGATIYLFSPIMFSYASRANLAPGTVFFAILISFYFLRFIKDNDDRDLILTAYFIGIGFMYKRGLVLMFVICFTYLAISRIMKKDFNSFIHFKVLLLSLVPILPWLKISVSVYDPIWSNLFTFRELMAFPLMLQSQLSSIIFFLFIVSFIISLVSKRDALSFFHGLLFIAYYLFFTLMEDGELNHRYAMVFYPVIAVLVSQFIFSITQKTNRNHAFKIIYTVLIVYLIFICLIPRSSSNLTTWKYKDFETQYYPIDEATDWIKNRPEKNSNVLVVYTSLYEFYIKRIYTDRNEINQKKINFLNLGSGAKKIVYPLQNLKKYCKENNISYIMFTYSPKNSILPANNFIEKAEMTKYLHDNMNNEFKKITKFDLEDNYIFIYKTI